ncbi:MAG: aldehyde dehydrogenase family protein [bacterium]|nr:aldehyde dehydrogenase family protein [bacterium]
MREDELCALVEAQRISFARGETLPLPVRIMALERLRLCVKRYENEICEALYVDLGKCAAECRLSEIDPVRAECSYMLRNIRRLAREKTVCVPPSLPFSRGRVRMSPLGNVLILSPWYEPFAQAMLPLVDAIAAGNTVVVKPSAYAPRTGEVIASILAYCMLPCHAAVVMGGREENRLLMTQRFDHIFFSGSERVGREVLRHAAETLTPVTLMLGGKNPVLVDHTARLDVAARRIVFGKLLSCGQTSAAPDFVLAEESVCSALTDAICLEIRRQLGDDPLTNPQYGRIVNEKQFTRLIGLLDSGTLAHGGTFDAQSLRIAPTVLHHVPWDSPVMRQEILGPILPILSVQSMEEAVELVAGMPQPLAMYLFSRDRRTVAMLRERCRFGGGCVNDTLTHQAGGSLAISAVGASGMGAYRGKRGYETFSHVQSMVERPFAPDPAMRYQPYETMKERFLRRLGR